MCKKIKTYYEQNPSTVKVRDPGNFGFLVWQISSATT